MSGLKSSSHHLGSEGLSEKACMEELESSNSFEELKLILSKLDEDHPSCTLFKGKYQVLKLDSLFKWHKPFGELLKQTWVICGAKPKKNSEAESHDDEVFSEESGGSPMDLTFSTLLKFSSGGSVSDSLKHLTENHFFFPLSENIGKKLLLLWNSTEEESVKKLPVLVVCHGKNSKPSSFLGSWRENKNARFHVFNKGTVTKQEQLPKLPVLKKIHLRGFPPSFSNIELSVYARYDFIEYECEQNAAIKPVKDVNLFVECSWSNCTKILEPLSDECQCFARLKTVCGDFNSGAFSLFKEIKLVETLHQSLENGVMTWSTTDGSKNILQEVKEFIQYEKLKLKNDKSVPASVAEKKNPDLGAILEQALIKERIDLDFTEKLWNILKDCSSTEELTEAFNILYNELRNFSIPPSVHHKNTSTIAQTIKTMREKVIACPNLESQLVLSLLLEIGVEKLRRDYVAIFFSLELIPLERLTYFLQPRLLSSEAITCLKKLHSAVELTIVCLKILNVSKPLLSLFVSNTLKHYSTVSDIDLQHVFNFQIPTSKARQLLDPMRPTIWELSLTSSQNGFLKQSIHRYQATPVPEHIYAPKNTSANLMLKTACYTYLTSDFVQDDLL